MTAVLLDTHAWAWSLAHDERLSPAARDAIHDADTVLVSPITFFEIAQKVRLGEWPDMEKRVGQLPALLGEQGGSLAGFGPEICVAAGLMRWTHHDPFDRLLAATAMRYSLPFVSADTAFDGIVTRVW